MISFPNSYWPEKVQKFLETDKQGKNVSKTFLRAWLITDQYEAISATSTNQIRGGKMNKISNNMFLPGFAQGAQCVQVHCQKN